MSLLPIVVLAAVLAITDVLPVSASANLQILSFFTGWKSAGPVIELASLLGTLLGTALYLWRDIVAVAVGLARAAKGRRDSGTKLAAYVVLATVPAGIAAFALERFHPIALGGAAVVAWVTIGFGIVLYLADKLGMTLRRVEHLRASDAIVIGFAQILALIPGTSRGAVTIAAARVLGFERRDAARFSLLLSLPATAAAAALLGFRLWRSGDLAVSVEALAAAGTAFVAALVAIAMMMAWLRRATFTPFVVYRLLVGGVLLAIAYGAVPKLPWW